MIRLFKHSMYILSCVSLLYIANAREHSTLRVQKDISRENTTVRKQEAISIAAQLAKNSATPAQEFRDYIGSHGYNPRELQAISDELKKLGYTVNVNEKENAIGIEFVSKMSLKSKDLKGSKEIDTKNKIQPMLDTIALQTKNNGKNIEKILPAVIEINRKIDTPNKTTTLASCPKACDGISDIKDKIDELSDDIKNLKNNLSEITEALSNKNYNILPTDTTVLETAVDKEPKTNIILPPPAESDDEDGSKNDKTQEDLSNQSHNISDIDTKNTETPADKQSAADSNATASLQLSSKDTKLTSIDTSVTDTGYMIETNNEFLKKIMNNLHNIFSGMDDGSIVKTICADMLALSNLQIDSDDGKKIYILDYIKHLAELKKKHTKLPLPGLCKQDLANNRLNMEENGNILPASINHFENAANEELYTAWLQKKDVADIRNKAIAKLKYVAEKNEKALKEISKRFMKRGLNYKNNQEYLYEILNLCSEFNVFIIRLREKYGNYPITDLIENYITNEHIVLRRSDNTFERISGQYDTNYEKIRQRQEDERKAELARIKQENSGNTKKLVDSHSAVISNDKAANTKEKKARPSGDIVEKMVKAYSTNKGGQDMNGIIKKKSKTSAYNKINRKNSKKR